MKIAFLAALAAATVLLTLTAQAGQACAPVGKPFVYKTVGDRQLKLYVVTPEGAKPGDRRPAIVFLWRRLGGRRTAAVQRAQPVSGHARHGRRASGGAAAERNRFVPTAPILSLLGIGKTRAVAPAQRLGRKTSEGHSIPRSTRQLLCALASGSRTKRSFPTREELFLRGSRRCA